MNLFMNYYRHGYTGIMDLFIIYREFDLYLKILNFNDRLEIWWRHLKIYMTLINILAFFERSYEVPYSCKVS